MKRIFLFPLIVLLAIGLVFGGCAKPAPAPTPAPAPAPTPAPIAQWDLKFHSHAGKGTTTDTMLLQPWLDLIEEATGGRVKGTNYFASALGKDTDAYDFTAAGVADMAWVLTSFTPGRFPVTEIVTLPLLGIDTGEMGGTILWKLYERFPEPFNNEYPNIKLLCFQVTPPYQIAMVDKPIHTLEDIKGTLVRTVGGPPELMTKALGATPVLLPYPDIYMSLEKGVVDGLMMAWSGFMPGRFHELLKYYTVANLYSTTFYMIMNLDTWNSFPPDIQEAIWGAAGGLTGTVFESSCWDKIDVVGREGVNEWPDTAEIYELPPEEFYKWRELCGPIWDQYIGKLEAKGIPGQQIFDEMLKLIDEYK